MSTEDAADGKILSPIAHLSPGLIPAGTLAQVAKAEKPRRFSPGEIIAAQRYKILGPLGGGGMARYTGRTIRSWIKTWR